MAVTSRKHVAQLLQERQRAMAETRFRPENYSEIHRVLGLRFAPDLGRVVTKQRANAASAYLKRLHHDIERSKEGFYEQLHALPLQCRRMTIHKEDQRCFKSVLVPKLKLSPLTEFSPSPHVSPHSVASSSRTAGDNSTFVPHKSFSPYTNTHIHVLYKQGPGAVSPKKPASVVSNATSVVTTSVDGKASGSTAITGISKVLVPSDGAGVASADDTQSDTVSSVEESSEPYSYLRLMSNEVSRPPVKKRLVVNLMPRSKGHFQPEPRHQPIIWGKPPLAQVLSTKTTNNVHSKMAAASSSGWTSPSAAVYKFVLPSKQENQHTSQTGDRHRVGIMGSKLRYPLPSIPRKMNAGGPFLAITPMHQSNMIRAAA